MNEAHATNVVVGTGAAITGVVAEPIIGTIGLIFMGAFGGALVALMNVKLEKREGYKLFLRRWLQSMFISGTAMHILDKFLRDHSFEVPHTLLVLAVSFLVAQVGKDELLILWQAMPWVRSKQE